MRTFIATYLSEPAECWIVRERVTGSEPAAFEVDGGGRADRLDVAGAARRAMRGIRRYDSVIVDGPDWGCGSDLDDEEG